MNRAVAWSIFCWLAICALSAGQEAANPEVLAKVTMNMKTNGARVAFAQKGDLLTQLDAKENLVLVRTSKGTTGWVKSSSVVKLADAAPLLTELLRDKPRDPNLYSLRANVWAIRGDTEKAIADCDQAIKYEKKEPELYVNRGVFHASAGEFDKAIADYNQALKMGSKAPAVFLNRASAFMAKKDFDSALKDYTALIAADSKNANYFVRRGVAHRFKEDFERAIADFTSALAIEPDNLAALSSRGFVHYLQREHKQAVGDFDAVIKLKPDDAMAYNNRGYNRHMSGDYASALVDYDKAIELNEKYAMAYQNKAWLLATCPDDKVRDGKAAFTAAKQACMINDFKVANDVKALAAAYAESRDFKQAVKYQTQVIEKTTGDQKSTEEEILKLYQTNQPFRSVPVDQ